MYGHRLAAVWDMFYRQGRGKDYAAEARQVTALVREQRPGALSLLDVGCGTGEHLATFAASFDDVAGVDLSTAMLAVARKKVPDVPLHAADMRDFALGRTFDAVVCMNTGVAYLPSRADLAKALARMAHHLSRSGVLVVEPWWFPERFLDGHVAMDTVRAGDRHVSRMSRTTRRSGSAHMEIHYLTADAEGVGHFRETHVFGLWSCEDYLRAFHAAGCTAAYVPESLSGYGMFVARPQG